MRHFFRTRGENFHVFFLVLLTFNGGSTKKQYKRPRLLSIKHPPTRVLLVYIWSVSTIFRGLRLTPPTSWERHFRLPKDADWFYLQWYADEMTREHVCRKLLQLIYYEHVHWKTFICDTDNYETNVNFFVCQTKFTCHNWQWLCDEPVQLHQRKNNLQTAKILSVSRKLWYFYYSN